MSSEALLTKIKADADARVEAIQAETAQTIADIEAATAAELAALQSSAEEKREQAVARITAAAEARARHEGKLLVQAARREAFDAVMDAAAAAVGENEAKQQEFNDRRAELELVLARALA